MIVRGRGDVKVTNEAYSDTEATDANLVSSPWCVPRGAFRGNQLQIKCCCEDFRRQLLRHADSLMYQTLHEDMGKEIRRILRGKR